MKNLLEFDTIYSIMSARFVEFLLPDAVKVGLNTLKSVAPSQSYYHTFTLLLRKVIIINFR